MSEIEKNIFYRILFDASVPMDQKSDSMAAVFRAAANNPEPMRRDYTALVDHLQQRNKLAMDFAMSQGPGAGNEQAEIARMHYMLGLNQAQEFLFDMLDKACKQSGASCLEPQQISATASTLEGLKVRNTKLKEHLHDPHGLKDYQDQEAARSSVVANDTVAVRKKPLSLRKLP